MSEAGLPIGEIARRSGVSEATLRAWERRYGLLEPERTDGGHRRYREQDVEQVRRVVALIEEGWSAGSAAAEVVSGRDTQAAGSAAVLTAQRTSSAAEVDADGVAAAYRAALELLRLEEAAEAPRVLSDLVEDLGGRVVPAAEADDDALPVDLSFGFGEPVLPAATPLSIARMRLEFLLPELVEAARRMVDLQRARRR